MNENAAAVRRAAQEVRFSTLWIFVTFHYLFFSAVEIAGTGFIVWSSFTWKREAHHD